jgi:hypothetical protein
MSRLQRGALLVPAPALLLVAVVVGCTSQRLQDAIDNPEAFTTTTVAVSTLPPTTLPPTTTTTSTTTTTLPPTTTTTLPPLIIDGAVVMVANASGVDGAAKALLDQLAGRGFAATKAVNAAGPEEKLDISKIYFRDGGEAAARSIAALMGNIEVAAMPTPAWIVGASAALGDANVLVMLGRDFAGASIPGISPD